MNHQLSFARVDYALFVLYLAVLLAVSWKTRRTARNSEAEYLLAGRRLTLPAFIATLVTTWYGGILGVGEYTFLYGISNWLVFGLPYYLAAILFALFIVKPARKNPMLSIPDQLHSAYGRRPALAGAMMVFIMTVPASYVLMLAELLKLFLGGSLLMWLVLGTLFSTVYVAWGGFRAIVRTDKFQFILMYFGFALLLVMSWHKFGGLDFLQNNLPETHFQWHGGLGAPAILVWYFIAMATLIEPSFYQRVYAAKSAKTARNGILISIAFWILFDFMTTFTGLYARAALGPDINPTLSFPLLADQLLPPGVKGIFFLALASVIMSTVDSYSFLAAQTLSRDIVGRWRDNLSEWKVSSIQIGLLVLAIIIAAWKQTVIGIWHDLGSIGIAVLLLPMAGSFRSPPLFPRRAILPAMVVAGSLTLFWTLFGNYGSGFPLGIQPV
ncbi:sodium:solute symporter family protein, partial [Calditrichota bacterium]